MMIMWSDDPVRDAERWEQEKERKRIGGSWFGVSKADLMEYEEEEEDFDDFDGYGD